MSLNNNLWYLGAQFMAGIQARDRRSAQEHFETIQGLIAAETNGRFSYFKLRILQVLTNGNRAAFNAGASTDLLAEHSRRIVAKIDRLHSRDRLLEFSRMAVERTIDLVPGANAYQDRIVQEAIAYIEARFNQPISRDELAAHLECSATHFSRVFSKTTGYTYKEFLLQCRLERAKQLLQSSYLRVAEIANACGFPDPFHFSKAFRRRLGVSPRKYRESRIAQGGQSDPA